MMGLFVEWAGKVNDRVGRMIPAHDLQSVVTMRDPGFRSVYMFSEKDAHTIQVSRSSAGFSRFQPYSDCLFIDLDDGDTQVEALKEKLAGLEYEIWSSGGKGYHFHIKQEMVAGFDVPYSQRCYVESLGVKFDASIYQPNSLIALPGRIHSKTRKRKALVSKVEGKSLELPIVQKPEGHTFKISHTGTRNRASEALLWLSCLIQEPPPGERHITIWKTAKAMAEGGFSYEMAEIAIMEIVSLWENQKTRAENLKPIRSAYLLPKLDTP